MKNKIENKSEKDQKTEIFLENWKMFKYEIKFFQYKNVQLLNNSTTNKMTSRIWNKLYDFSSFFLT
jgi:hypothetical protein